MVVVVTVFSYVLESLNFLITELKNVLDGSSEYL